jgi:8-oxo-dGTP diphosphatase
VREIREELSASVAIVDELSGDGAPWRISDKYVLRLFRASVIAGELRPGADHDALRWLRADEFEWVEWLPSDRHALPAVRSALTSSHPTPVRNEQLERGLD